MPASEICFEPGDLVEFTHRVEYPHRFSVERDAAIVLECSVSDGVTILFGEQMITKLLTIPYGICTVYNYNIRLIQRGAE